MNVRWEGNPVNLPASASGDAWRGTGEGKRAEGIALNGQPGPGTTQNAVNGRESAADRSRWQKQLDHLNQRLSASSLHVQFDPAAPANQIWLNVIDTATGQVIQKIPPDKVRAVLEASHAAGWAFDRRS